MYTRKRALKFANFPAIERVTGKKILSKNYALLVLRIITLCLVIFSISGCVLVYEGKASNFDIVLAIDSSGSMLAEDYKPNRIEVAKEAALGFLNYTPENSRIGVISFSGVPFIKQRLTSDMKAVEKAINNISVEPIGGTAIGSAIITATNLLIESEKTRLIILLTDGQNNVGPSIEEAIRFANENNVNIYAIGVATKEGGLYPNLSFVSKLDSETLKKIAEGTNGKYYEAKNETAIFEIYQEIATSTIQKISLNLSPILMLAALILLFIEWGLLNTKYRTIP
jgi:Ca-activated chloride channel family protein